MKKTSTQPLYLFKVEIEGTCQDDALSPERKAQALNRIRWRAMQEYSFYSKEFRALDKIINEAVRTLPEGAESARVAKLYGCYDK